MVTLRQSTRDVVPTSPRKRASGVWEVDPLSDPRWNALIENHPQASVFHSTAWLTTLRTVYGYEPFVLTTSPPRSDLTNGLVFCRIKSWLTGWRFVSLPFSDHCEALVDGPEELDDMLLHLKKALHDRKWQYLEIRPIFHRPGNHLGLETSLTYHFHRLDLRKTTQELFHAFHKDCVQRKIRRAEREDLRYEDGNSEALLQKFYRLMVETRRRQFLPPQPLAWFRGLVSAFGNELKIRVASILTLRHHRRMVYKYGGSIASQNKLGGMALLFWKTIQEAKDMGLEELDLGRSDTDNLGLITFKEHWGATRTAIEYWTYPARSHELRRPWQKNLVRHLVEHAPDLVLEGVGTLLYKHIG
jgi:CelD/BcsL family acetyltransferase involved in cellulose biosynthesis